MYHISKIKVKTVFCLVCRARDKLKSQNADGRICKDRRRGASFVTFRCSCLAEN